MIDTPNNETDDKEIYIPNLKACASNAIMVIEHARDNGASWELAYNKVTRLN